MNLPIKNSFIFGSWMRIEMNNFCVVIRSPIFTYDIEVPTVDENVFGGPSVFQCNVYTNSCTILGVFIKA